MYVITGATGNTGSGVTETLLAAGAKVRVIGRDARRLERFTQRGAEAFVADVTDAAALEKAFSGAKAVYAMIPPNSSAPDFLAYSDKAGGDLAAAIRNSGVTHAVVLSSFGAERPDKTGPVVGLHNLERRLTQIAGLNALFLRCGYFMENLLPQVGAIQKLGMMAGPVRSDLPLPMIATHDIGSAAGDALLKLDFTGPQTRELQGARDVTYAEAAKIIGAAIGNPSLAYQQVPGAMLKPAFAQLGMSPSMADMILEMSDALNSGYMKTLEPRSPVNTTATTLETFVAEAFVLEYRAKIAHA